MTAPRDSAARTRALDLSTSFCIRAPAGSGKTGLLICRMLAALAVVDHPEQVLAITFTRKAAAEIRERLALALASAASGAAPADDYARRVHELAQQVRARSQAQGWELENNPHRIRASTIDSLNRELARQMPVLAGLGGSLEPVDDARELYRTALQAVLEMHDDPALDPAIRHSIGVTLALGKNRLDALLGSLSPLLAQREQWAQLSMSATPDRVQESGSRHLEHWVLHSLQEIDELLPRAPRKQWLACLQQHAADGRTEWQSLTELDAWPAAEPRQLRQWQTLARSLLTGKGEWRKPGGLSAKTGFPAGPTTTEAKPLLEEFSGSASGRLPQLLSRMLLLPADYAAPMAEQAAHLLVVLRHALAQLKVDFAQRDACDHTELALAARHALQAEDQAAAARADARYQHILVDEMQDTSNAQLELLEQLVVDWQPGDGRSLFLVGDPQQSIYLFRHARVEKFNALLRKGARLGPVPLQPLELTQNFRSIAPLVHWCNRTLEQVFRDNSSPIDFAPSDTDEADSAELPSPVTLVCEETPENEAQAVAGRVRDLLATSPDAHIGVLARTRAHLRPVARALRQAGTAFSGVELEALRDTPAIRNYLAIVRVLHQPEDDFASLRLLRSPGVGLSWAQCDELVALLPDTGWAQRTRARLPATASAELTMRLGALQTAMTGAEQLLQTQGDLPSAARALFHALRLPESLDPAEQRDVRRFEIHLREACTAGQLRDESAFERSLDGLWADTDATRVELMTVHKSKGLEFDHVILAGLGRSGRGGDDPLLTWHPDTGGAALAIKPPYPYDPRSELGCLYRWLRQQHQDAEAAEGLRLLYVAVTRARSGLHLCMTSGARRGSLGAPLKALLPWPEPLQASTEDTGDTPLLPVRHPRLAAPTASPQQAGLPAPSRLSAPPPSQLGVERALVAAGDTDRLEASLIGSSVHEALEYLTTHGVDRWKQQQATLLQALRSGLARRGLPKSRHNHALEQITGLVNSAVDGQGALLMARYPWHRCEYAISGVVNGRYVQGVVDRCFENPAGERWIVDYKTNTPAADRPAWHTELATTYRDQLERYAQLLAGIRADAMPTRLVLYLVATDECLELLPEGYQLL